MNHHDTIFWRELLRKKSLDLPPGIRFRDVVHDSAGRQPSVSVGRFDLAGHATSVSYEFMKKKPVSPLSHRLD